MYGRRGDDSDFVLFSLSKDVNFIEPLQISGNAGRTLAYHTSNGSYFALHLMRDAKKAYKQFGFESFDSSTIVNRSKVQSIEPTDEGSVVKFFDGTRVHVRKKFS